MFPELVRNSFVSTVHVLITKNVVCLIFEWNLGQHLPAGDASIRGRDHHRTSQEEDDP
jgi:hypothetical protein